MNLHNYKSRRGNLSVFVAVMIVSITFLLLASLQVTLTSHTLGLAWDVRKQNDIAARAAASLVKDSILAKYEFAPSSDDRALSAIIGSRLSSVYSSPGPEITDSTNYGSHSFAGVAQWPSATPAVVSAMDFNSASGSNLGRNVQSLLSAGAVADLGTLPFSFSIAATGQASDLSTFSLSARLFAVPLTNFTLIPYGQPATTGGVTATVPPTFTFTRSAGFTSPIAHSYRVGDAGAYSDLYPSMPNGTVHDSLPFFYRDLIGISWSAMSQWLSTNYQNTLLMHGTALGSVYNFSAPSTIPPALSGSVSWSSSVARLNLGSATVPSLVVFDNTLGGGTLQLDGTTGALTSPVVIVVRNNSASRTIIRLNGNNARPIILYAPNSNLTPVSAGLSIRGAVVYFPNTVTSGSFSLAGSLFYPQNLASPPPITVIPDATARSQLANVSPRALVVSTRINP